jgi:hypothetical protein
VLGDIDAAQRIRAPPWLDIRSVIGYSHDVPEYRWQLVAEMDQGFVVSHRR